ncbi:carboxypeptidase PM20D1 [Psychromicrobium silvestre]|uniref:Carboxypeptidase PM20D1 n=1 Tax=Psychromicrobium silvestre TaxID=1645614 RepID=A0A7Y9S6N9_9MICC|nr:M20/M25/M40 family metallo-hydrolase [Psychromicrobium silvestre]NYE94701.1 carboxypeptidase PM20D1 [Psychromicrobium silvestre]
MASVDPVATNSTRVDPLTARAAENLTALIGFRTVSYPDPSQEETEQFEGLISALEQRYPLVHGTLERERVNAPSYAQLFRWPGSKPQGRPTVLMAHLDVVPVDPDDPWSYPPFSGTQADGYLWGRGALDDKGAAVAILEAVESLIAEGFRPVEDVYLSFGTDEEVGGRDALAAVELLAERRVRPWLVLDEGGAVAGQAFPGVEREAAMIGVAEKGLLTVTLTVQDPGGHSATPPRLGSTARLARAITRLERKPFPVQLHPASARMLEVFAAEMSGAQREVLGRARKLSWPLARLLPIFGAEASAVVRTTTAVTQLSGSKAANVLAATASATVNLRIAVGSTVQATIDRLRKVIRDPKVELKIVESSEPSAVSSSENDQFAVLAECVREVFPEALVAPYLMMAMTDSRRFTRISDAVYRFVPFRMSAAERGTLHAVDERLSLQTLGEGVRFYRTLLRKLT